MHLKVVPPDPKLAKLIMHVLAAKLDGCETFMPAALSPTVILFVRGAAQIKQADGSLAPCHRFFLSGPAMTPINPVYAPGTISFSVCLWPGMLHQATGIFPSQFNSLALSMAELFDAGKVDRFLQSIDANDDVDANLALFQHFLLDILDHSNKTSIGAAFLAARKKMFFPMVDLSQYFGIGQRQLERRVREAFGVSLRDVRRIARFGQTLPRMINASAAWGDLTAIAQDSGYYDQAHMHREFVKLAGIAPLQLLQKIASGDPAYWLYRINEKDFRNLFLPPD
ncbi:MAG: helix-turn-helix domain-containing protein [Pseudomonadota bacterium]